MKQCRSCWQLLPGSVFECTYCGSEILEFMELPEKDLGDFKVNLKEIEIQSEKYDIAGVLSKREKGKKILCIKGFFIF